MMVIILVIIIITVAGAVVDSYGSSCVEYFFTKVNHECLFLHKSHLNYQ